MNRFLPLLLAAPLALAACGGDPSPADSAPAESTPHTEAHETAASCWHDHSSAPPLCRSTLAWQSAVVLQ